MALEKRIAALAGAVISSAITAAAQLNPAEEGRRVYLANNCYGCHGGRAGGGVFGFTAPQFRDERVELGDLTEVIRQGAEEGMPAFPNLTTTDINNLFAYFQSLRTPSEPTFNRWWEPVPTARVQPLMPRLLRAAQENRKQAHETARMRPCSIGARRGCRHPG